MSSEWEVSTLRSLVSIKHGFAFKGEFFVDEITPFQLTTPGNFAIGGGFQSGKGKYYAGPVPSEYVLNAGDLIVTMTDLSKAADTLGYSAVVPNTPETTWLHNQRVGLVTPIDKSKVEMDYIHYLMRSASYRHWVVSTATGSTVKHTSPDRILSYEFLLPPMQEQRAISKMLASLDDRITLLRETNATLEAIAQALFKSWFVDFDPVHANAHARAQNQNSNPQAVQQNPAPQSAEAMTQSLGLDAATAALFPDHFQDSDLGPIPAGWRVTTVESFAEKVGMGPFGSNIKVETFVESGVPVISGQHLRQYLVEDNTFNFITNEHAEKLHNSCVFEGDVIFTHAGSIGQVSMLHRHSKYKKYVLSQRQFYLRCNKELMKPEWVAYYFNSAQGQYQLLANTSQVGVPSIARPVSYLKSIKLVMPSKELIDKFSEITDCVHQSVMSNRSNIETLTQLRDTLLPRLISGQLRLPEAESLLESAL